MIFWPYIITSTRYQAFCDYLVLLSWWIFTPSDDKFKIGIRKICINFNTVIRPHGDKISTYTWHTPLEAIKINRLRFEAPLTHLSEKNMRAHAKSGSYNGLVGAPSHPSPISKNKPLCNSKLRIKLNGIWQHLKVVNVFCLFYTNWPKTLEDLNIISSSI